MHNGHVECYKLCGNVFVFFLFQIYIRYEFGNKGADVFLEALARLNHYLKVGIISC